MLDLESRKRLTTLVPYELIATKTWLRQQGLSLHFIDNAVKGRVLKVLVPGVYARYESTLNWKGIIASLQRMSDAPVGVGGLSALNLEGLAHYQERGKLSLVHLYSDAPPPAWLGKLDGNTRFKWHGTRQLWQPLKTNEAKFFRQDIWRETLPPVIYSVPEKAIVELLSDVPKFISFEHADRLMEGLSNLSPRRLDVILQASTSIKSKRLFMWLAGRHNHPWLKHLKPENYDFGSGKRELVSGGRLDKAWNITVPREMSF